MKPREVTFVLHERCERLLAADISQLDRDRLLGQSFDQGWLLLTSRASYEMIQKAATVGIGLVAAISAPTGLAIRLAHETGVTLVAFTRDNRHTVYANPQRLTHQGEELVA
jgi:FdhD protein